MSKKRDFTDLIEKEFGAPDAYWKGDVYHTYSPLREDNNPGGGFIIFRNGGWKDAGSCDEKGEARTGNIKELLRIKYPEASREELRIIALGEQLKIHDYLYQDAGGRIVSIAHRVDYEYGKDIKEYHIDPVTGDTVKKRNPVFDSSKKPVYHLPNILAQPKAKICIVEGEKAADAPGSVEGWIFTTSQGGAGRADETDWSPLEDRDVYIWPDNDSSGLAYAKQIAAKLRFRPKIVDVSSLGESEDVADLVEQGRKLKPFLDNARPLYQGEDIYNTPAPEAIWLHMTRGKAARPMSTVENLKRLLNYYGIEVKENLMEHRTEVHFTKTPEMLAGSGKKENAALGTIQSLCQLNEYPIGNLDAYIVKIGHENRYHPIQDAIEAVQWDGESRLQRLYDCFEVEHGYDNDLKEVLLRKWLISAVAALYEEPFRNRGVLTLQGPQGIGKTSIMASLFWDGFEEGLILDPRNKDQLEIAISSWVCEMGELEGTFKRQDIANLKAFLTRTHDSVRMPYERRREIYPRRTVFCATVNDQRFLNDATGSTRFWVIPVVRLNYKHGLDVMQIWAEVKGLYDAGFSHSWWLTPEEERRLAKFSERHNEIDTLTDIFLDNYPYAAGSEHQKGLEEDTSKRMSITQILKACGKTSPKNFEATRLEASLKRMGYKKGYDSSRNIKWIMDPAAFYVNSGYTF